MSGTHTDGAGHSETVNLKASEAHLASLCVAIVFGLLGGGLGLLVLKFVVISTTVIYLISAALGFLVPWIVCNNYFPTAHHWYGANSIAHRIYDLVGIVAAVVLVYLVT